MDEMVNDVVVEESAPAAEATFDEGVSDSEFDAMWNDDDSNDEMFAETESEAADQPTEESAETEETQPTEAEQSSEPDADQYLELKHFDEVKKVNKDEARVLAQKGMDYDRIRGKLDEANAINAKLQKYEDFLNELKGGFNSIDDLMNDTRARLIADKEGITREQALERVKSANQMKEQAQQQAQVNRNAVYEEMRRESLTSFISAFPGVKAKDIPQEVWDDMKTTNNLVASYAKYQAKKLADENAVLKKNAENKARSTGSMKSSGKPQRDEFDAMWYEDDY